MATMQVRWSKQKILEQMVPIEKFLPAVTFLSGGFQTKMYKLKWQIQALNTNQHAVLL